MKKFLIVSMLTMLTLSATGCNYNFKVTTPNGTKEYSSANKTVTATTAPTTTAETKVKVTEAPISDTNNSSDFADYSNTNATVSYDKNAFVWSSLGMMTTTDAAKAAVNAGTALISELNWDEASVYENDGTISADCMADLSENDFESYADIEVYSFNTHNHISYTYSVSYNETTKDKALSVLNQGVKKLYGFDFAKACNVDDVIAKLIVNGNDAEFITLETNDENCELEVYVANNAGGTSSTFVSVTADIKVE